MVRGQHDGIAATIKDVVYHPVQNVADLTVNIANAVSNYAVGTNVLPSREINKGATAEELNHQDKDGNTVLHAAGVNANVSGYLNVAARAIEKDADVTIKNNNGDTALINALNAAPSKKTVEIFTKNGEEMHDAVMPIAKNPENAPLIKHVIKHIDDKEILQDMHKVTESDIVKTACEHRTDALDNPFNNNLLKTAKDFINSDKTYDINNLVGYIANETVETSDKIAAGFKAAPHAPTLAAQAAVRGTIYGVENAGSWLDMLANATYNAVQQGHVNRLANAELPVWAQVNHHNTLEMSGSTDYVLPNFEKYLAIDFAV